MQSSKKLYSIIFLIKFITRSRATLHPILQENHPNIKFTYSANLKERRTMFLNTTVKIVENTIVKNLYRKPSDVVQYLLQTKSRISYAVLAMLTTPAKMSYIP